MNSLFDRERRWLLEEKYHGKETEEFLADLEALRNGTPLAYLIGNIPFLNCTIDLSERPLIPRVETEYWVSEFITKELNKKSPAAPLHILDIFAGSGCIGTSVLKNTLDTFVDFAEFNQKYIRQIQKNLDLNGIAKNRYGVYQSDVFENVPVKKYDYILANPPYISHDEKDTVEKSVLNHEDHAALFADDDGLFFIKKLIETGRDYLAPGGKMYIEHGSSQKDAILKLLELYKTANVSFLKDQYEKDRVLVVDFFV